MFSWKDETNLRLFRNIISIPLIFNLYATHGGFLSEDIDPVSFIEICNLYFERQVNIYYIK